LPELQDGIGTQRFTLFLPELDVFFLCELFPKVLVGGGQALPATGIDDFGPTQEVSDHRGLKCLDLPMAERRTAEKGSVGLRGPRLKQRTALIFAFQQCVRFGLLRSLRWRRGSRLGNLLRRDGDGWRRGPSLGQLRFDRPSLLLDEANFGARLPCSAIEADNQHGKREGADTKHGPQQPGLGGSHGLGPMV
jgi:hypothetical protein